jgi:transcriptional regulator with XRE-family HTH domain
MTQARLSELIGVEPRSLQRLEAGENCSIPAIVRIADALGVTVASLFREGHRLPSRPTVGRPRSTSRR